MSIPVYRLPGYTAITTKAELAQRKKSPHYPKTVKALVEMLGLPDLPAGIRASFRLIDSTDELPFPVRVQLAASVTDRAVYLANDEFDERCCIYVNRALSGSVSFLDQIRCMLAWEIEAGIYNQKFMAALVSNISATMDCDDVRSGYMLRAVRRLRDDTFSHYGSVSCLTELAFSLRNKPVTDTSRFEKIFTEFTTKGRNEFKVDNDLLCEGCVYLINELCKNKRRGLGASLLMQRVDRIPLEAVATVGCFTPPAASALFSKTTLSELPEFSDYTPEDSAARDRVTGKDESPWAHGDDHLLNFIEQHYASDKFMLSPTSRLCSWAVADAYFSSRREINIVHQFVADATQGEYRSRPVRMPLYQSRESLIPVSIESIDVARDYRSAVLMTHPDVPGLFGSCAVPAFFSSWAQQGAGLYADKYTACFYMWGSKITKHGVRKPADIGTLWSDKTGFASVTGYPVKRDSVHKTTFGSYVMVYLAGKPQQKKGKLLTVILPENLLCTLDDEEAITVDGYFFISHLKGDHYYHNMVETVEKQRRRFGGDTREFGEYLLSHVQHKKSDWGLCEWFLATLKKGKDEKYTFKNGSYPMLHEASLSGDLHAMNSYVFETDPDENFGNWQFGAASLVLLHRGTDLDLLYEVLLDNTHPLVALEMLRRVYALHDDSDSLKEYVLCAEPIILAERELMEKAGIKNENILIARGIESRRLVMDRIVRKADVTLIPILARMNGLAIGLSEPAPAKATTALFHSVLQSMELNDIDDEDRYSLLYQATGFQFMENAFYTATPKERIKAFWKEYDGTYTTAVIVTSALLFKNGSLAMADTKDLQTVYRLCRWLADVYGNEKSLVLLRLAKEELEAREIKPKPMAKRSPWSEVNLKAPAVGTPLPYAALPELNGIVFNNCLMHACISSMMDKDRDGAKKIGQDRIEKTFARLLFLFNDSESFDESRIDASLAGDSHGVQLRTVRTDKSNVAALLGGVENEDDSGTGTLRFIMPDFFDEVTSSPKTVKLTRAMTDEDSSVALVSASLVTSDGAVLPFTFIDPFWAYCKDKYTIGEDYKLSVFALPATKTSGDLTIEKDMPTHLLPEELTGGKEDFKIPTGIGMTPDARMLGCVDYFGPVSDVERKSYVCMGMKFKKARLHLPLKVGAYSTPTDLDVFFPASAKIPQDKCIAMRLTLYGTIRRPDLPAGKTVH